MLFKMAQAVVICLMVILSSVRLTYSDGSTRHLKEIMLGRCWDFQRLKVHGGSTKNCSKIWETFYKGFAYKAPCNYTFADYKPYFDEVGMDIVRPNKSLFWSGTYKEAHLFSALDARFITLEDTMAGGIVNGLTWCGTQDNTTDGINYTSCPGFNCSKPFWGQASQRFAQKASGIVRVLVSGSRTDGKSAYRNDSIFAEYELPNFYVENITKLRILVVHNIDGKDLESCGHGTIKLMTKIANSRGINTTCHDNPDDVRHLLCVDHPRSRECQFFTNGMRNVTKAVKGSNGSWKLVAIIMIGIAGAFCLIAAVIGIIYVIRCKKKCTASFSYREHTADAE